MREEDQELLLRVRENVEFEWLKETLEAQDIDYNELALAKQFVLTNEPFAEIEPEH